MVKIVIGGKEYSYPEGWHDVTLGQYMDALKAYTKPKALDLLENAETKEKASKILEEQVAPNYAEIAEFYKNYCHFWTKIPLELLGTIEGEQVSLTGWDENKTSYDGWKWIEALYIQIRDNFMKSKAQNMVEVDHIEHNGQKWYLPEKHMKKSTVNGFIEVSQAEHIAKQVEGNQAAALPKMVCILLRKTKGAKYDPRQMQREGLFMSLTMDKVQKIGFFLCKLNERSLQNFLIYTGILHLSQLRHSSERGVAKLPSSSDG